MAEPFDRDELLAAVALDDEIERTLTGHGSDDSAVTALVAAFRTEPPASLSRRVHAASAATERRALWPVRVAVAALAGLFLLHGSGNFFRAEWVAENLHEAHSPHASTEGGLALLAVAVAMIAGLWRRHWLPVAVTTGVPLGLAFGVVGFREADEFAAGAALHLSECALAIAVAATWFAARRYARRRDGEGTA